MLLLRWRPGPDNPVNVYYVPFLEMAGLHTEGRFEFDFRKNMTPQQIADMFDDFAEEYELEYLNVGLRSHVVVGDFMAKTIPKEKRPKVKILDVAAGTGLLGNELKNRGFTHIDALDPAEKMLNVPRRRKIYQRLICAFMKKRDDSIVVSAAVNEGLIPCDAFQEMIRIVKPGGQIIFTVPTKYINNSDNLRDQLLSLIHQLAQEGVWEVTSVALADGELSSINGPGTLFSLKVLVSEKTF